MHIIHKPKQHSWRSFTRSLFLTLQVPFKPWFKQSQRWNISDVTRVVFGIQFLNNQHPFLLVRNHTSDSFLIFILRPTSISFTSTLVKWKKNDQSVRLVHLRPSVRSSKEKWRKSKPNKQKAIHTFKSFDKILMMINNEMQTTCLLQTPTHNFALQTFLI